MPRNRTSTCIPSTLLSALGSCDVDSLLNIHRLFVIACTLTITSTEVEVFFTFAKDYSRTMLASEHLSDIAVMSMRYSERISVDEILQAFIQAQIFQATLFVDWTGVCMTVLSKIWASDVQWVVKFCDDVGVASHKMGVASKISTHISCPCSLCLSLSHTHTYTHTHRPLNPWIRRQHSNDSGVLGRKF